MNDRTETEDNDGTWPDGTPVCTPFPISDEEVAGPRSGWPWVTAEVRAQCGPDEWELCITDEEAVTDDGDGDRYYPVVFRDASEIRLLDPTVQELTEIFFADHQALSNSPHMVNLPAYEHGGAL